MDGIKSQPSFTWIYVTILKKRLSQFPFSCRLLKCENDPFENDPNFCNRTIEKSFTWVCANSAVSLWVDWQFQCRPKLLRDQDFLFFSLHSPQPEWQTVCRGSKLQPRSALILLTRSNRSMSVNQALPSARIRNKFRILRKQLWLGCCENWSLGWRAPRTHSSLAGGVLPWEAITAGCQLTASFQSESGLAWSSGTL